MFDNLNSRIGFACKYMHHDQYLPKKELENIQRAYNGKTATITNLRKLTRKEAYDKIKEIVVFNMTCYENLISYVAKLPYNQKMLRLGSDLLPGYTHTEFCEFYDIPEMVDLIGNKLSYIGELSREYDIRLSMHPGQYVSVASENPEIVNNALLDLEYHAYIAKEMGYGKEFQDFKINVHLSGKKGISGFLSIYPKFSEHLRNMLTLENDEYVCGIDDLLPLADKVPIVLDIHHHWIKYDEYIKPNDNRIELIKKSWRGVKPVIHYSYSSEEVFPVDFKHDKLYSLNELLDLGLKRNKLRAHSSMYPNNHANMWALSHLSWADIMCEAKSKNLASSQLAELV